MYYHIKKFGMSVLELIKRNVIIIMLISGFMLKAAIFEYYIYKTWDLNFILDGVMFVLLLSAISNLLSINLRMIYLTLLNLILSTLLLIDMVYYRAFECFPLMKIVNSSSNLYAYEEAVLALIEARYLVFFIDIVIVIIMWKKIKGNKTYAFERMVSRIVMLIIMFTISSSYLYFRSIDFVSQKKEIRLTYVKTIINPFVYHFSDILYSMIIRDDEVSNFSKVPLTPAGDQEISKWFKDKNENLSDNKYKSVMKGNNIVFIQMESLENFVIGNKVNNQEITPNLNKLLKNSLYFTNFFEQVNLGNSSDADLLVNTSVYPLREGHTFSLFANTQYNSLPKILKNNGYYTSAFYPVQKIDWNWGNSMEVIGFDNLYDDKDYSVIERIGWAISDKNLLQEVFPLIKKQKQPFYSVVITISSHTPFKLPKQYRELNLQKDLDESYLGGYLQSIHYTDKQLGEFIKKLDDEIDGNTTIVIYGDHTGVHKYFNETLSKLKNPEDWWMGKDRKIPLIIYNKKQQGEEIDKFGGLIDVLPTICYLTGVDEKEYSLTAMGRNLLNTQKNFVVLNSGEIKGTDLSLSQYPYSISDKIIKENYFKFHKND